MSRNMRILGGCVGLALLAAIHPLPRAQSAESPDEFLAFVRSQAAELRAADKPPAGVADWERQRAVLRQRMLEAWGGFPAEPCPLEPRTVGTLRRDGYRVEKVLFQTRPGIWMTANAYVPDKPGKLPAVLCVHGHWRGAKQDPTVQSRCLGLVKHGFFVLAVDAFGAGERAVGKALGEYHGEMVAATLLPVGLPLSGLQVYENMRAVDYLLTRPEVDPARLGITGASGGGNQSMYAGAWDERFAAAVPVCSVGNYQAYLGVACCMCEVVPGALRFTEEWGVLGLTAPRGLMVVNATKDGVQFSVAEARKSLAFVQPIYAQYGKPDCLKHAVFDWRHDYNRPMREVMYGWMTRFLKGSGDGAPLPEPEIKPEDPEQLRCFPGESRPDDFVTIPRFAAREARKLLSRRVAPADGRQWHAQREAMLRGLSRGLFGCDQAPAVGSKCLISATPEKAAVRITFEPEPGLTLTARQEASSAQPPRLAVLLDLEGAEKAAGSELAATFRRSGWGLVTLDLRATGRLAYARDKVGRAPDHNTAEWSLWLGRPLLGQWGLDVRRLLDAIAASDGRPPKEVLLCGVGPAGVVAFCAAALDQRVTRVATAGSLASYVTYVPYEGQRLGIMVPGILRDAGDIPHLAALVAPRPLVVGGGVTGAGQSLDAAALGESFTFTRLAYSVAGASDAFCVLSSADAHGLMRKLK